MIESNKKIVLVVGAPGKKSSEIIREHKISKDIILVLLQSSKISVSESEKRLKKVDYIIDVDFSDEKDIFKKVVPIRDRVVAIVTYSESGVSLMAKVVNFLPGTNTISEHSLDKTSDKYLMREMFMAYDKKITPNFILIDDFGKMESIIKKVSKLNFPVMIKPASLASSILIDRCDDIDELKATMPKTIKGIEKEYKKFHKFNSKKAKIVVEEFVEGDMYSMDGFVDFEGNINFYPLIEQTTGKDMGFSDYFIYMSKLPQKRLGEEEVLRCQKVVESAVRSLSLSSTHFHIELKFNSKKESWKVIEITSRVGFKRIELYKMSYGIDVPVNEIYSKYDTGKIKNRTKVKSSTCVFKIFPNKNGKYGGITNPRKIKDRSSFHTIKNPYKLGDSARKSSSGGSPVVIMFNNKKDSELLKDIEWMKENFKIKVI